MTRDTDDDRLPAHLSAIDHIREGVQVLSRDMRYLYLNPAAASQGQRQRGELLGQRMVEMYPGIDQTEMFTRLRRCAVDRVRDRMENLFTYPDGTQRWFELRMEPVPDGVLLLSIDIHQRKRLEEQLNHAQRMEAVGRLAGGVAHDFNNLLTVVQAYASLLEQTLEGTALQDAREILAAADRGAALTRQLLAISRRQSTEPVLIDVDEVVGALRPMLDRILGEQTTLVLALGCGARVRMGAGQLDQVLLNIAANAKDAMTTDGKLVVRTDQVRVEHAYALDHLDVQPGLYALISVTDNGAGMDRETQARIFEPFFTTKANDGGTGLGLATSHGLIKQAGGHIWVYSEPARGTTFKIYLPLTNAEATPILPQSAAPTPRRTGTETVLVVDDEPAVVTLCTRVLADLGYTVLGAEGVDDALRFAARYSGRIDAVITDVVMPGGTGPELVAQLRQARPGLPMLYLSGYIDDERLVTMNHSAFLEKPFTPDQLARQLRELLDP